MTASAGTREKLDALVTVSDDAPVLEISIRSPVADLFGSSQRRTITRTLRELVVSRGTVTVEDSQALDCVLKARIKAAVARLRRAGGML
jgi:citrate lyase subunit gamma (acyl carrier protein)